MAKHQRQGLNYNSNEQYVWGHWCPCLFYLEAEDFIDDDTMTIELAPTTDEEPPLISLHVIMGIRTEDTM